MLYKRQRTLLELVSTECEYLRDLGVLVGVCSIDLLYSSHPRSLSLDLLLTIRLQFTLA